MEHTAGLCHCGCGERTPLSPRNEYRRGHLKGQPIPFLPGHRPRRSLEDRFWARVRKTHTCWLWTGSRDHRGYGRLQRGTRGQGHIKAHRLSYELRHGPFDDALVICHRCDNPSCVNPDHLFLGSQADNVRDAMDKQRHTGRPLAAVPADVIAYYDACGNQYETAQHFGISQATVSRYRKRR